MSLLANGLVMFSDFVADIPTTNSACDGCQRAAVAATDMTAYEAADQGANTDAKRAVLRDRSRLLLIGRCWSVVPGLLSLGQRGAVPIIGGWAAMRTFVADDRFISNNLAYDGLWRGLLCNRDVTVIRHFRCRNRRDRTMRVRQKPCNRGGPDQADQS